jgi:hypothetical protein
VRRQARRAALAVAAAGVLLLGGAVLSAWTQPTSAAWTDSAIFKAAASSGSWSVDGCVWVDAVTNQPVTPAPACTVTVSITPYYLAGIDYSDPTTGRAARFMITFGSQATGTQVPMLTLRLNQGIIPSNWNWSTSRLTSSQVTTTGPCTTLPLVTGSKGLPWYFNAELILWEKGTASPTVCTGA